jgi:hypothetical protein
VTIVYPGEIRTDLHGHERDSLPAWRASVEEGDPAELAREVVEAVEKERRAVYYPLEVRALRAAHGVSPRVADLALRRLRGITAAPRSG